MTAYLQCANWSEFQHYKDRDPPWIKLHRKLLGNYAWAKLPDVAKAHVVGLWLIAARHDNKIPADPVWIGRQMGANDPVDIERLVESGFLEPWDASKAAGKREDWPSRYIPESVKKAVWKRDGGRCQGCGAKKRLEYDHVLPISKGGKSVAENLQLLCAPCNRKKRNELRSAEQVATQETENDAFLRSLETERETEAERETELPTTAGADSVNSWLAEHPTWAGALEMIRAGVGMPDGRPPTEDEIALAVADIATKPNPTPILLRQCIAAQQRAARRNAEATPPPKPMTVTDDLGRSRPAVRRGDRWHFTDAEGGSVEVVA